MSISARRDPINRHLLIFLAVAYSGQGIVQVQQGIVTQPINALLVRAYGWSPVEVSYWVSFLALPWVLKPIFGLISDLSQSRLRRVRYLVLFNALAAIGLLSASLGFSGTHVLVSLLIASIGIAAAETVAAAVVVERGQQLNASSRLVNQQQLFLVDKT